MRYRGNWLNKSGESPSSHLREVDRERSDPAAVALYDADLAAKEREP